MSNVTSNKVGHPVVGILLGIFGIGIALLMTLLFGVIAGAIAGLLGIGAALLGISARKQGGRGMGAIVTGVLAVVLAISMTFVSANILKTMKEIAESSGVAPTFAKFMDNPYMGISGVAMNAVNASKDGEIVKTIQKEMEALKDYMTKQGNTVEKTTDNKAEDTTGFKIENSTGVTLSIGG